MKSVLLICLAIVLAVILWDSQTPTMRKLSERAASADGVEGAEVRAFIRERMIDICNDDADRTRITQLTESDCALAIERKDMLCSVKMQFDREAIIHSEESFQSYAESYIECLYPDNTDYVGPHSLPTFPKKGE